MLSALPKDPIILLGVVNTKLRDFYRNLDELCEDMEISKEELIRKLETIDYCYDAARTQFV